MLAGSEYLEERQMLTAFESFDGVIAPALPVGWTQTATSTNSWATVAGSSDSGSNHAFVANAGDTSESILTSPTFVLPASTTMLQFRNSYNMEFEFDGGVLEISINGSSFSDVLTAGGSFISGGYVTTLDNRGGNPVRGRLAWTGNSDGYITTAVNLPATAINQNVQLRWRFGSDESVAEIGWRIDTISLETVPTVDFGDAPAPYPVTLAEDGARHVGGALRLGSLADLDSNGIHSDGATADGEDEDGVAFDGGFTRGTATTMQVTASQAGGLLNAWVDWNADGDWSDFGEQIFADKALTSGVNSLTVYTPPEAIAGNTFARFRISTDGGLGVTGAASDGEVEDYLLSVATVGTWANLGPFGATNGQVEGIVGRPVTGAIHVVLAHPTNADILYVGSVNGGVWKTSNATAASPNWTPLTDGVASQSIGALSFDLSDPTFDTIYAGMGNYSSFAQIGNSLTGLIRSTNGGQSWQVVDGAGVLQGKNISGIYANGDTVVVSVNVADSFAYENIGIFRSTNGGASFTQMSSGDGSATGLPGGVAYDLFADPVTPATLYTSIVFSDGVGGVNGVYKSEDSGATWAKISSTAIDNLIVNNTSNLEIAVGRSNEVYAAIINAGKMEGLFRSPDGGVNWTQMDSPKTNENGTDVGLNPSGGKGPTSGAPEKIAGGQGSIHFSIAADPDDSNIVYVGGDRQPRAFGDTGGFPNSIGAQDFSGRLFRGDASKAPGSQFVHLTHRNDLGATGGGTASNSSPHADSRDMAIDANGNLVEVDDGGVYRRTSPQNNTGDWFSVIGNLSVTESHDAAWDSLSNVAITGNQDTGTTFQRGENVAQWDSISTADGGDVAVDNIELAGSNQSVRYTSFQNLGGFRRTIWNAAGGLVSTTFPGLTPINGSDGLEQAFRTPVETNSVAGGRLLIQGSNGLYESLTGGETINAIGAALGQNDITLNALAYGGTQNNVANPDLVWAAQGSDVFVRTSGIGNVVATTADPTNAEIRDLAVNSVDWANAFVIDNNQVFQTTNVGAAWSDITGNLMSLATDLRSIAFIAGTASSSIIVGTNFGVYASTTAALGTWFLVGNSLPNVLSYDLDYDAVDDVLLVGTMGRGAWQLQNASSVVAGLATPTLTITSTNATYNSAAYVATASIAGNNAPAPGLSFVYYSDAAGSNVIPAPEDVGTYFVRAFATANSANAAVQSAIAQFEITAFTLAGSITAADKNFDGTTDATILTRTLNPVFSGDDVSYTGGTASFDTAAFGVGKTVTASGLSLSGADAGNYLVNSTATTTANINAVAKTPGVTNATTDENVQTTSGLVITRNPGDGVEVTHFRITTITGGRLFQNNGITVIHDGDFITFAQANAGLKFTPALNSSVTGHFTVQASTSNVVSGLGGSTVTANIMVNAFANTPSVTNATTLANTRSASGLVISRNAGDGTEVSHFKITNITGGSLFRNDGTTAINNGDFITFAEANAGLKFTPDVNSLVTGHFTVQASLNNGDAGLGGSIVVANIVVTPAPIGTSADDVFVLTYSPSTPGGTVSVTISSNGGPAVAFGTFPMNTLLTVNGQGGNDSIRVAGTSDADSLTVNNSFQLTVNGANLSLTSIENRTLSGAAGNDVYKFDADTALGLWTLDETEGGTDTVDFSLTATVGLSLNMATAGTQSVHATNLRLVLGSDVTIENSVGGAGADTLFGNSLDNTLTGGAGDDKLLGAGGNDLLIGGANNDTYIFVPSSGPEADRVTENIGEGTDTLSFVYLTTGIVLNLGSSFVQSVHTNRTLKLNSAAVFENVIGGTGADTLFGNSLNNTLTGGAGDDKLLGAGGNDLLIGGANNDTYIFVPSSGPEADQVTENIGEGTDTLNFAYLTTDVVLNLGSTSIQTVHTNRTLKLNSLSTFENAVGGTGRDTLLGNTLANRLTGGEGHNILVGMEAGDILEAGGGRDILVGGLGLDILIGGAGDDILIGGRTTSDTSLVSLNKLRAEWISGNTYAVRITNLRAGVGNPFVSLKTTINVLNDAGENDSITGGANSDWFFRALDDVITDLFAGEIVDVL